MTEIIEVISIVDGYTLEYDPNRVSYIKPSKANNFYKTFYVFLNDEPVLTGGRHLFIYASTENAKNKKLMMKLIGISTKNKTRVSAAKQINNQIKNRSRQLIRRVR